MWVNDVCAGTEEMKREDCRGLGGRGPELALGMYVDLSQNSASICASSFVDKFIFKKRKWTVEVDGGGRNTGQNAHSDGQTATNPIRIVI